MTSSRNEVTFAIASDLHPVLTEAIQQSHARRNDLIWQWLQDNSAELPNGSREFLPEWLSNAAVNVQEQSSAHERAYGRLYQHEMRVTASRQRLSDFPSDFNAATQQSHQKWGRHCWECLLILTMATSAAAMGDRWTQGYRRLWIAVIWCMATAALILFRL